MMRSPVSLLQSLTAADLDRAKETAGELQEIIEEAIESVAAVTLAAEDKDAIKESLVDRGFFSVINEEEFLRELRDAEVYFSRTNGFVGLKHFVKTRLGDRGYDYRASYDLATRLDKQGRVKIYQVENPYEGYPTSAIRILDGAET